ncbi:hypothetical protein ACQJBY_053698 [Aegilops geniculata]
MGSCSRAALMLALPLLCFLSGATMRAEAARMFTIINKCEATVWPAVTPGGSFGGGGFELKTGQSAVFTAPPAWSGRIWGRTDCAFDQAGTGKCGTGACGAALKCGASGDPPASLAEFTLATTDFYDVSLVDGFNLPITVTPVSGRGNCSVAGCDGDLRDTCPAELSVKGPSGKTAACRSACDVFNTDQYCCRGKFGGPSTCPPTPYSKKFKEACPSAYSYAYDDPSSLFQCSGADYVITFCANSRKQSVCTHHNNKLECGGSSRRLPIMPAMALLVLLVGFVALQVPM